MDRIVDVNLPELAYMVFVNRKQIGKETTQVVVCPDNSIVIENGIKCGSLILNKARVTQNFFNLIDFSVFPKTLLTQLAANSQLDCVMEIMRILSVEIPTAIDKLNEPLKLGLGQYKANIVNLNGENIREQMAHYVLDRYMAKGNGFARKAFHSLAMLEKLGLDPEAAVASIEISLPSENVVLDYKTDANAVLSITKESSPKLINALLNTRDITSCPTYSQLDRATNIVEAVNLITECVVITTDLQAQYDEQVALEVFELSEETSQAADEAKKALVDEIEYLMHEKGAMGPNTPYNDDMKHIDDLSWDPKTLAFKKVRQWYLKYSKITPSIKEADVLAEVA